MRSSTALARKIRAVRTAKYGTSHGSDLTSSRRQPENDFPLILSLAFAARLQYSGLAVQPLGVQQTDRSKTEKAWRNMDKNG